MRHRAIADDSGQGHGKRTEAKGNDLRGGVSGRNQPRGNRVIGSRAVTTFDDWQLP